MTWRETPHVCELPSHYYGTRIDMIWECDHCKREWRVISQSGPDQYGGFSLGYATVVGSQRHYRSFF